MTTIQLWRRAVAEFTGTAALVTTVVGSGIMAQRLSADGGVRLLANSLATVLGLAVLIAVFGPISGAHFNPVVSVADWWLGRRTGGGLRPPEVGVYAAAQTTGAIAGAIVANLMFALPAVTRSTTTRAGGHLWLAEVVATTGLLVVIGSLTRHERTVAVAAYIGAAYWFTSSTSFANPAVTIGRAFTDTHTGIAPAGVPGFVIAQGIGLVIAVGMVTVLGSPGTVKRKESSNMSEQAKPTVLPTVLFVCVHNAGRSQMAAGWLRHLAGDRVRVLSAGSAPKESINPVAVEAMAEVGIDITGNIPQKLESETAQESDVIVTMGCGDACPYFAGKRYEDWELTDPAGQPLEVVRRVRDEIRERIEGLLKEIVPA